MTTLEATKSKNSSGVSRSGRLFVLELSRDRIHSLNPDGSDRKTIVAHCNGSKSSLDRAVVEVGDTQ